MKDKLKVLPLGQIGVLRFQDLEEICGRCAPCGEPATVLVSTRCRHGKLVVRMCWRCAESAHGLALGAGLLVITVDR